MMERVPVATLCRRGVARHGIFCLATGISLAMAGLPLRPAWSQEEVYLGGDSMAVSLRHQQQWGDFGRDTAAAAPGRPGAPLQIGRQTFDRGLGHHANGEIVLDLAGQYSAFRATIGVQWQGGNRGSVVFRIIVDGKSLFESQPMSDSDPAQPVEIPVAHARELRLVASDAGDGIACDMANWAQARLVRAPGVPWFGTVTTLFGADPAPLPSAEICGLSMIASATGPQIALMKPAHMLTVCVRDNEQVRLTIPTEGTRKSMRVLADVSLVHGERAEASIELAGRSVQQVVRRGEPLQLEIEVPGTSAADSLVLSTRANDGEAGVRWQHLRYEIGDILVDVPLRFPPAKEIYPPPTLPDPRPAIVGEFLEWDWRMQDGIGTSREPRTWAEAVEHVMAEGDQLIQVLDSAAVSMDDLKQRWEALRSQCHALTMQDGASESQWYEVWRHVHEVRRDLVFHNPLSNTGPIVFAKRVPSCFSHQLTQYYGMCARPGGGIFVLDAPGRSMHCRPLTNLPPGSYQHPEVDWDGRRILFAYCEAPTAPTDRTEHQDRVYHIYQMGADGSALRQLTAGPYDDFSPRYLPDGKLLFLSTRRGGFHRCGAGPCPVYTLATANADGSDVHSISYHETHEWDPAVLSDGRVIYTRWDYVDRHAVHYQQLWTVRPDGTNVAAYYGNNTFNPVGVWEARPVPNSERVMATAGAHHAMTAGSIILLDVARGIDGPGPVTRLTTDVLFPESEFAVQNWHATAGIVSQPEIPVEEKRWPGHCYRTPYPLSEDFFLAAYSFDPLIGEPGANKANMFGIYLVDRFGNKELIYRDLNIGSLWPTPLRARPRPPVLPSNVDAVGADEGTFFLQNVYDSWPAISVGEGKSITHLRILQVLLKTTPHANTPKVGFANASPGKQVLGTVPVEPDGSAYFRAPARIPLAFQALDQHGMAVQTMRSLTYLQPGEHASCIGCHEHRSSAPDAHPTALARQRPPSAITPGPDGSKPLSYPILVQSVLDKHCVECHGTDKPDGGIALTGEPAGAFTVSYNALAPLVPYSEWKGTPADNAEPLTRPGLFGARASSLMKLLWAGHEGVKLSPEEWDRLITWMDANALFYGSFDPEDQKLQQRGERIKGPALE